MSQPPPDPAPEKPALAAVRELALAHGVDPALPPACEAEAAALARDPGIDDPGLADLTDRAFVTIDNPDSRDLDQALFIEDDGGGHVVWYALADAAHFVRPGTALWAEAVRRGSTVYLPGLVATMLPRVLCEDLVSLNPRVDRRAMVFEMRVDAKGRCRETRVHRARIRSRAKLSYEGVQAWLDGGELAVDDPAVHASLRRLVAVGERRIAEAESRDVVRFHRVEVGVRVGGAGMTFVAAGEPRNDVERYNEQISLLANIEGAKLLAAAAADADVQPIFRTHEPPRDALLTGFSAQLEALRRAHDLPEEGWSWEPGGDQSLAAFVRGLPLGAGPLAGVAAAVQRQALRTGGRSGFGADPGRHYGVGAEVYSRFTAPMREMVGVFVHKELWEHLGLVEAQEVARDEADRARLIAGAQAGRNRQRKLDAAVNRMVLDQLFAGDLAAPEADREATIMGVGRGKIYLRLTEPPIDVKAYAHHQDEAAGPVRCHAARAVITRGDDVWLRVGDRVRVRVAGEDRARDRWRLVLDGR